MRRFILLVYIALLQSASVFAQNCRAVSDCSSGKCIAVVRCDPATQQTENNISPNPTTATLADNPSTPTTKLSNTRSEKNERIESRETLDKMAEVVGEMLSILPNQGIKIKSEKPPPEGKATELLIEEARWCIHQSVRLQFLRETQPIKSDSLSAFSKLLHQELCGKAKIRSSVERDIVNDLKGIRSQLRRQAALLQEIEDEKVKDNIVPWRFFQGSTMPELMNYYRQFRRYPSACRRMADKLDPDGLFCMWMTGKTLSEPSVGLVEKYLKPAAAANIPPAMYEYALVIEKGIASFADPQAALQLYMQSAALDFPYSLVTLGWLYIQGSQTTKIDYKKALSYNTRAAELLHGEGASNLAYMYELGLGTQRDLSKAREWYEKSLAMSGSWSGQSELRLGAIYENGLGVGKNVQRARDLYTQGLNKSSVKEETKNELRQSLNRLK